LLCCQVTRLLNQRVLTLRVRRQCWISNKAAHDAATQAGANSSAAARAQQGSMGGAKSPKAVAPPKRGGAQSAEKPKTAQERFRERAEARLARQGGFGVSNVVSTAGVVSRRVGAMPRSPQREAASAGLGDGAGDNALIGTPPPPPPLSSPSVLPSAAATVKAPKVKEVTFDVDLELRILLPDMDPAVPAKEIEAEFLGGRTGRFPKGTKVNSSCRGSACKYPGKIWRYNGDGTYEVVFEAQQLGMRCVAMAPVWHLRHWLAYIA
jgi:hypothetical protein